MTSRAADPNAILKHTFGYDSFRPHQLDIISAVLAGRDVLAVMPTSAGKSLCYQVPALALGGLTVVVSPLVSLMVDQVQSLAQVGVSAAYVNSMLSPAQRESVLAEVAAGSCTIVYVAPERLDDARFVSACRSAGVCLVAIDEAHCISQWGNDFRPSYQRIASFLARLAASEDGEGIAASRPPVCALTATATDVVRRDIIESLELSDPFTVVAGFDRPNLSFSVVRPKSIAEKDRYLVRYLKERVALDASDLSQGRGQSGIVYCSTRKAVESVCESLEEAGICARPYHAGLAPAVRDAAQMAFINDRVPVIVATNAFGMGIDKSNVSFVVHYNLPLSLEAYYQEAGRAGRDGMPAECTLIYSKKDVVTAQFLIDKAAEAASDLTPEQRRIKQRQDDERLRQMTFYATTKDCLRGFILHYFGERTHGDCGNCSNCRMDFKIKDVTVEAQKIISCVLRLGQRGEAAGRTVVTDILRGSKAKSVTERSYDTLSTYGIMADVDAGFIESVTDELIAGGYLHVDGGSRPVLRPTESTRELIAAGARFAMKVPYKVTKLENAGDRARGTGSASMDAAADGKARASKQAGAQAPEGKEELFDALKALRLRIAEESGVPPYVVFTNASIRDMCLRMPDSQQAFLDVAGVGAVKAQRYGQAFLDEIAKYR